MCDALKKQAKERALDMEAAAEKIFLKKRQVYRRKKYESVQDTQVSTYEVNTAPACDCSHAQPHH